MKPSDRVILLAQGAGSRLELAIDYPKQFILVAGKPVITRTVDLVRGTGITDIRLIAADDERWQTYAKSVALPLESEAKEIDQHFLRVLSHLRHLWSSTGQTFFIYTDVVFSRDYLQKFIMDVDPVNDISFMVRFRLNVHTGRKTAEIYGFSFKPAFHNELDGILAHPWLSPYHKMTDIWDLLHKTIWGGSKARMIETPENDFTDDLDHPDDLARVSAFENAIAVENQT